MSIKLKFLYSKDKRKIKKAKREFMMGICAICKKKVLNAAVLVRSYKGGNYCAECSKINQETVTNMINQSNAGMKNMPISKQIGISDKIDPGKASAVERILAKLEKENK